LCKTSSTDKRNPTFFVDSMFPNYINSMLFGLEFDFLTLNALVIIAMDRAKYCLTTENVR